MAHSTAGDGRRAAPGRLRPPVRAPRPQQPGRVHPGDTHSGDVDRRTAGWQGAGTPGFSRAASGAVELPFWRREEIALRFGTEDALLHAELTVQLGGADALGWSATRRRDVLDDINGLNAIVQSDSAAAAAGSDVDWRAIEALMRILDDPPPAP